MSAHALEHYTQIKSVWVDLESLSPAFALFTSA